MNKNVLFFRRELWYWFVLQGGNAYEAQATIQTEQQKKKPSAALVRVSGPGPRFGLLGGVSMDLIDALWYGAVLEKQDEKRKDLARVIEQSAPIGNEDGRCGFLAPLGMT